MTKRGPGRPRTKKGPRGAFADRFRRARAARGLTQAQTAAELGVHTVSVGRWEIGASRPTGLALRFVVEWMDRAVKGATAKGVEP
jgi:transcriptional regulator with XRE-family HTH domain